MVGLFYVNSAAFSFLELMPGHHKCPNLPPLWAPPLDPIVGSAPGPLVPQSTEQNYGSGIELFLGTFCLYNLLGIIMAGEKWRFGLSPPYFPRP